MQIALQSIELFEGAVCRSDCYGLVCKLYNIACSGALPFDGTVLIKLLLVAAV